MKIGQITSNSITENEDITNELEYYEKKINYKYFENPNISKDESAIGYSFKKNITYYLRTDISASSTSRIKVLLCNLEDGKASKEMPVRIIPNYISGYYDFIFTPDRDYNYLIFISEDATNCGAILKDIFCEKLKNILENKEYKILKDIGIQGEPGLRFSLNGEDFTLGKSGYFYLADLEIRQLGFHIRENYSNNLSDLTSFPFGNNGKEFFIVSFQY